MSDQAQPPVPPPVPPYAPPYGPPPGQPMPMPMSPAALRTAAATEAARSFFKANMTVGILAVVALGLSLVAGIIGTSTNAGSVAAQKWITILHQSGQILILVAVGVFFFKRLMPSLNAWVISVTNAAFGGVLSLILNVIFLFALAQMFRTAIANLCGGIPDVVGKVFETVLLRPTEILCVFLGNLSLPNVAMIALGAFAVAVIVKSMFLADKK